MGAIFSAILGLLLFWIRPIYAGKQALRGFMLKRGIDVVGIPLAATEEMAAEAYKLSGYMAKASGRSHMEEYTRSLELKAEQVEHLLFQKNRAEPFLKSAVRVKAILERHGVSVPPLEE